MSREKRRFAAREVTKSLNMVCNKAVKECRKEQIESIHLELVQNWVEEAKFKPGKKFNSDLIEMQHNLCDVVKEKLEIRAKSSGTDLVPLKYLKIYVQNVNLYFLKTLAKYA